MPPGLMSRRKSRHLVWEMGNGEWGMGNRESGMGNREWGIGTGNRNGESESASAGRERGKPIIPIAPPESL